MGRRIGFVVPGFPTVPVGGYRVVFEYANRLVDRGHCVTLLGPRYAGRLSWHRRFIHRPARAVLRRGTRAEILWHPLAPSIRLEPLSRLQRRHVSGFDVLVATAWPTADDVARVLGAGQVGAYLIQHYEVLWGPQDLVDATWRLPLVRIVVSKWLEQTAAALGALPATHIPNAVDVHTFRCVSSIAGRRPHIAMMWHPDEEKCSGVGLAALEIVRRTHKAVAVSMFSAYPRPDLPSWVDFRGILDSAAIAELFNDAAVFVSPSRTEGWGLPGAEALACGCALVTTDSGGVRDYARHGETALVVSPDQPEQLAAALLRVLEDDDLRVRLATRGASVVREEFSWERSTDALESLLLR